VNEVVVSPLTLTPPAGTGQVNVAYDSSLVAAGGVPPYTFAIANGSLPPGLTLNTSTGAITGTPTTAGTFNFTAQVVDSSGNPATNTVASKCTTIISGVNTQPSPGFMTGGGSVFTGPGGVPGPGIRVTHGGKLHCGPTVLPNSLEINWNGGNKFHLEQLTQASCLDDKTIDAGHSTATFNTFVGVGIGNYNGREGYSVCFVLTDAGESGKKADTANYVVGTSCTVSANSNSGKGSVTAGTGTVLKTDGPQPINSGNNQAHN
jgi:hypothetical protein